MRYFILFGAILAVATAVPVAGQEIAVHGSSAVRHSEPLRHGLGVSLAGSFRLGDILVDSNWARRANFHVGFRASFTEASFGTKSGFLCIDFCPPNAHDVSVVARTMMTTVSALPYVRSQSRLEVNGGIASYRQDHVSAAFGYSWRTSTWGFVAGAAVSRRFGASPFWLHLAYTRHADGVTQMADDGTGVPQHSVRGGLMLRFADWVKPWSRVQAAGMREETRL